VSLIIVDLVILLIVHTIYSLYYFFNSIILHSYIIILIMYVN